MVESVVEAVESELGLSGAQKLMLAIWQSSLFLVMKKTRIMETQTPPLTYTMRLESKQIIQHFCEDWVSHLY